MTLDARFLKRFRTKEFFNGNGSTTVFNLASVPQENETVDVQVNGIEREEGVDYTLSGSAITFTTAPANAQRITVTYWKNRGE